jgi:hypothetical protein
LRQVNQGNLRQVATRHSCSEPIPRRCASQFCRTILDSDSEAAYLPQVTVARNVLQGGLVARRAQFLLPILALIVVLSSPVAARKKLTANEAKDHIGETATVCGSVVSARYAASTKGQPDFSQPRQAVPESGLHGAESGARIGASSGRPRASTRGSGSVSRGRFWNTRARLRLWPVIASRSVSNRAGRATM